MSSSMLEDVQSSNFANLEANWRRVASTHTLQDLISADKPPNERPSYKVLLLGMALVLAGIAVLILGMFPLVAVVALPPSKNELIRYIQSDRYYHLLVPLTVPVTIITSYDFTLELLLLRVSIIALLAMKRDRGDSSRFGRASVQQTSSTQDPEDSPLLITTRRLEDDFDGCDLDHHTNSLFHSNGKQMLLGAIPDKTPLRHINTLVPEEQTQSMAVVSEQQHQPGALKTVISLSSKRFLSSIGPEEPPSVQLPTSDTHLSPLPRKSKRLRASSNKTRTASAAFPRGVPAQPPKQQHPEPAEPPHPTTEGDAARTQLEKTPGVQQSDIHAASGTGVLPSAPQRKRTERKNKNEKNKAALPRASSSSGNLKTKSSKKTSTRKPSRTAAPKPLSPKLSKAVCGKLSRLPRLPGQVTRIRRSMLQSLVHIGKRSNVEEQEIREAYGNNRDISRGLRKLIQEGLVLRSGPGGKKHPFVYKLTDVAVNNLREYKKELAADATARIAWDAKANAEKKKQKMKK